MAQEPVSTEAPVVTPDPAATNSPSPISIKDDDLVEVIYKGQPVVKPWKEARANIQMQEDYTRSKQEVSKQAKELKELYDTLKSRESSVAEKETALDRILGRSTPSNTPTKPADDEVPSFGQLRQEFDSFKKSLTDEFQSTLKAEVTRTEQQRAWERWEDLTNTTVDTLLKENPTLSKIPRLANVLKLEAADDKPQSEKEMVASLVKAGKRLAKSLDDDYTERRKSELARKQTLTEKGPVPPGGTPQYKPLQKEYGPRGKINWDQLEKDILEQVEGLEE